MDLKNIIILILAIAVAVLLYLQFGQGLETTSKNISPEEATNLVLAYINEDLPAGTLEATLAGDVEEESGLYKFQIKIGNEKILLYATKDGKILLPQGIDLTQAPSQTGEEPSTTLGYFSVSQDEICKEDGKPIIYFFGAEYCSYCKWEHPIIEAVAEKFSDYISFHNNMDSAQDMDVFSKYSPRGYVPAVVLGCKYYRIGLGESAGEEQETENLTALICDLTQGEPTNVCSEVEDLIQ